MSKRKQTTEKKSESPKTQRETVASMLKGLEGVANYVPLWGKGDPLGYNTMYLEFYDDSTAVRYHKTNIIAGRADGSLVIDTGGYGLESQKTRERVAHYAMIYYGVPIELFVHKGKCYYTLTTRDRAQPFEDGLVIAPVPIHPRSRDEALHTVRTLIQEYDVQADELYETVYVPLQTHACSEADT
jgi:hypothetical protein